MKISHEIYYISHPDKNRFTTEIDCLEHEENYKLAEKIIQPLGDRPDSCSFSNGSMGYIQHDRREALRVRNELLEFFKRYTDHKWIQETIDKGWDADPSWVSRIISEYLASSIFTLTWHRFSCIDSKGREYGQPYYKNNPDEASNKNEYNNTKKAGK